MGSVHACKGEREVQFDRTMKMSTRPRACPVGCSVNSNRECKADPTYLDQVVGAVHDSDASDAEGGIVDTLTKREFETWLSVAGAYSGRGWTVASCNGGAFWKPISRVKGKVSHRRFDPSPNSIRLYLDELLPLKNSVGLYTRRLKILYSQGVGGRLASRTVDENGEDHCGLRVDDDDEAS